MSVVPSVYGDLPGHNITLSPRDLQNDSFPEKSGEVVGSRPTTATSKKEEEDDEYPDEDSFFYRGNTVCTKCYNGFMKDRHPMWKICTIIICLFPCGMWIADGMLIRKCTTCGYEDILQQETQEFVKYVRPPTPEF